MKNYIDKNGVEYIKMKDLEGNEDLHEIARNIKFEDDTCSIPKNTTRKQFLMEIKSEIEWYFDFVSPPVNKEILNQEYTKILRIEETLINKENKRTRQLDNNINVIDVGYRNNQPVALVEKTTKYGKEYIIGFNYEIKDNKIEWGYGYYYDTDIKKAKKDFKKVLEGGNLANTFEKKKSKSLER